MKKSNWEKVGVIGVDAGLCWIGDPCYIIGKDASEQPVETWEEFCNKLFANKDTNTMQWPYKLGHPGLGVTVSTGYGDGEYDVFVRRTSGGRIAEVKVVFIDDDHTKVFNEVLQKHGIPVEEDAGGE